MTSLGSEDKAELHRLENEMIILKGEKSKKIRRSEELLLELKRLGREQANLSAEIETRKAEQHSLEAEQGSLTEEIAHLQQKINSL